MRDYNITLDISKEDNNVEDVWFIQGDIGGKLYFTLLDNSVPIDLTGISVIAFFENKNKEVSEKNITITDNLTGKGELEISNSILSIPGNIKVEVKLYKGLDLKATFSPFNIKSKKSIDVDNSIQATKELDVIQEIKDNATNILELKKSLTDTENKINGNIADLSTSVDTKLLALSNNVNLTIEDLKNALTLSINDLSSDTDLAITTLGSNLSDSITKLANYVDDTVLIINDTINTTVTNVNNTISETVAVVNKTIEDNISNINTTIESNITTINNSIDTLNKGKVDIIVSEQEPETEGLALGTIWVKPKVIEIQ